MVRHQIEPNTGSIKMVKEAVCLKLIIREAIKKQYQLEKDYLTERCLKKRQAVN